ncbi:alpha/beta fold hydrolase [Ruicaihuangia caeni]|uniref:alpha/beta fold hydrolase n=1 Tax=Ruicaihuangia caeni TaxID=3042517 RepID=UPI00338D6D0C
MTTPAITGVSLRGSKGRYDEPLLLGPSLGTAAATVWGPAAPALDSRYRLLGWDLPGHGESAPTTQPFSVAELAQGVIAMADAAGIDRFLYAGISLGGAVGLQLALDFPERVKGLAVVCASPRFGVEEAWRERARQVRASGTSSLVVGSAQRWFAPDTVAQQPEITSALLHGLASADDESYALCCEALAVWDVRDRLGEISAPTIAIAGVHDQVSPPSDAEEMAGAVARGEAHSIPDASHLAPAERPTEVAQRLDTFFGGIQ